MAPSGRYCTLLSLCEPEVFVSFPGLVRMDRLPFLATSAAAAYTELRLPAALFLHHVRSMYNVGAFFRSADGAGIERIFLSGITARPPMKAISKTALGSEEWVRWTAVEDPIAELARLRSEAWEIAAIETSTRAVDVFDWEPRWPVCVLFGHEVDGLPRELLDICDTHVRVPMLGRKHSLNVASAGAVVTYELLRKYRALK